MLVFPNFHHSMNIVLTILAVVKNNILYIDGGLEAFVPVNFNGNPEGDTPILGYSQSASSKSRIGGHGCELTSTQIPL